MKILIITEKPRQISSLQEELKKSSIKSVYTKPSGLKDVWIAEFHVIYIHVSVDKNKCERLGAKIREDDWESPIMLHHETNRKIYKSRVLTKNATLSSIANSIKVAGRKGIKNGPPRITHLGLTLHLDKRAVERGNKCSKLCYKEFGILELLIQNKGRVVRRGEIIDMMWDRNATISSNTLEVHISNLRKKVDKDSKKKLIHTVPQVGYRFGKE